MPVTPVELALDSNPQLLAASAEASDAHRSQHRMPFGAELQPDGSVCFRLWAPAADSIQLLLEGREDNLPMQRDAEGWHERQTTAAGPGSLYRFVLPDGTRVPDPASRFQPQDVHGPSEVIDPRSYIWRDRSWGGRPWNEAVLYELHLGAFTPEGTFLGAIAQLDHLVELGVTVLEIMPVADFPGRRSWGYDGVLLYAPAAAYGRPEDFKALVDAAHARGLAVLLDVVYNHFGPDGNYIGNYFPDLFTKQHKTNWGDAINYDGPHSEEVRDLVIHNALYWIEEFHLDGLRLDAVHAIVDDSRIHVLEELARRVRALPIERPIHLILENDRNQATRLERADSGLPTHYTAQWNDDMHHVLHTAATEESVGYYRDYQGDSDKLGRALAEGFCFQGETTSKGESRGERCDFLPPVAFVAFIQNHDQIGNRAFGERINHIAQPRAVRAIAAAYLLLPQIPMLFMGEEWCTCQPFPYFCDFNQELGDKVTAGRRAEFAGFPEFQDPAKRERIPDPQAESTFLSAKLDWTELARPEHAGWLAWYKDLLRLRRQEIVPRLPHIGGHASSYDVLGPCAVAVHWKLDTGEVLRLSANFSGHACPLPPNSDSVRTLWYEGDRSDYEILPPWTVHWTLSPPGR